DAELLRKLCDEHRRRGDVAGLLEVLPRLVEVTDDARDAATLRLELARVARDAGDGDTARRALEEVVAVGPGGEGYAEALAQLEALLRQRKDDAGLASLLSARAERVHGAERAQLLLEVSEALARTGRLAEAITAARGSVEAHPEPDALLELAALLDLGGEKAGAARARVRAADLVGAEERARLLLEAADALAACGEADEARAALERVHAEVPAALPVSDFASRLNGLGAHAQALEVGFAPLMAEGRAHEALTLADRAQDTARAREALWALARAEHTVVQHVERLAALLREESDHAGLLRLAELVDAQAPTVAAPLLDEVLFHAPGLPERERALRLHLSREHGDAFLVALMPRLGEQGTHELVDVALEAVRELPGERREAGLLAAVAALPERAPGLLRELYALQRESGRPGDAERTLLALLEHEKDPKARAALSVERGELLLNALGNPERARDAFERALAEDGESVVAVRLLLSVSPVPLVAERFVAMAERLGQLAGPEAVRPWAEQLSKAYEVLGRTEDAYRQLGTLEETPERLHERERLAEALGRTSDVLELREKRAQTPGEREAVMLAALEAGQLPHVVGSAVKLLSSGALAMPVQRRLAVTLAPTAEGADLASQLWPDLLSAQPVDAEGWRSFAESLRGLGQDRRAQRMEGVASALTDARTPAPAVPVTRVERPVDAPDAFSASPVETVAVTAATMPRLHSALAPSLEAMGAADLEVALDVQGGVEAYLAGPRTLVLGAGALACFGPAELVYLSALALALGAQGAQLVRPGPVPALPMAARRALRAVPSPLAAARVVAQLDPAVRGGDPATVRLAQVLAQSDAFKALALEALALG
ncbi:MAG: flagellar hook-length control protein FliK, partial [Myxococcaceae bacterium]|nr:flagellar hook-length control protein FliK [Myxococcaceae bacterium]